MKRPLFLFVLFAFYLLSGGFSVASAQRCQGYIAVDGALLEGQTACYFGGVEGADEAFIRTDVLTAALGLESAYDQETGNLRFRRGEAVVEIATTDDVEAALAARPDALEVGGEKRTGRSAILAANSYLPLEGLVEAFGGRTYWNAATKLIEVDFSATETVSEAQSQPDSATVEGADAEAVQTDSVETAAVEDTIEIDAAATEVLEPTSGEPSGADAASAEEGVADVSEEDPARVQLGAPRYGVHEGYTRVALDLPAGLEYRLAVEGNNFVVLFSGARAEPFEVSPQSPQLTSLGYAEVGEMLALIASTSYPLGADGEGFEVGGVAGEGGEVLYIDFAAPLRGEGVARLQDLPRTQLSTVRRPEHVRKTVVIDPGHGGKDPGAVSRYVVEKEVALSVALKLEALLEARGIGVVMTRRDDRFLELEARSEFAVPSEHNLFISLHANSALSNRAHGIETWVFGRPQDDSLINLAILENGGGGLGRARTVQAQEDAASISGDLLREENLSFSTSFAEALQNELIYTTESENRGVKQNYFSVIRYARVPAVLVELGFVNHPVEGPKLATEAYQTLLAESLAQGIEAFLNQGGTLAYRGPAN